jgi:alkanesulfonate monooxygenase SsuD/methylene tetrahydromethanopterin reductase-like flavin-dependent oxidoreductase (luciferase family)
MRIGIGLPTTLPGTTGKLVVDWAVRAEERGFSCLATIDRIAYPNHESLTALGAAAAVTRGIGLFTNILLAPVRSTALLAKEATTIDQLSGGRLRLGLAVGGRPDDYEVTGSTFHDRGSRFDRMLGDLTEALAGRPIPGTEKAVVPEPARDGGVPLVIGGTTDRAIQRAVRFGVGWTAGGGASDQIGPFAGRVREAWSEAGRPGEPYISALQYFSLGEDIVERSKQSLLDYYGFLGDAATWIAERVPRTAESLRNTMKGYEEAGVDEFVWNPTVPDLAQVDRLADAVL